MVLAVQVVARIRAQHPEACLTPMELRLDSLESVESFAEAFLGTGKRLDILMLNAGEVVRTAKRDQQARRQPRPPPAPRGRRR
jgi:hypothetical protein